jgi:hypothetical protein
MTDFPCTASRCSSTTIAARDCENSNLLVNRRRGSGPFCTPPYDLTHPRLSSFLVPSFTDNNIIAMRSWYALHSSHDSKQSSIHRQFPYNSFKAKASLQLSSAGRLSIAHSQPPIVDAHLSGGTPSSGTVTWSNSTYEMNSRESEIITSIAPTRPPIPQKILERGKNKVNDTTTSSNISHTGSVASSNHAPIPSSHHQNQCASSPARE